MTWLNERRPKIVRPLAEGGSRNSHAARRVGARLTGVRKSRDGGGGSAAFHALRAEIVIFTGRWWIARPRVSVWRWNGPFSFLHDPAGGPLMEGVAHRDTSSLAAGGGALQCHRARQGGAGKRRPLSPPPNSAAKFVHALSPDRWQPAASGIDHFNALLDPGRHPRTDTPALATVDDVGAMAVGRGPQP